jgi:hypothetical protein
MMVMGTLDFFEGLIAVVRDKYYALTPQSVIVFDVSTWGWITLIWGLIVTFAGYSLLSGRSWARWFAIVVCSLSFIIQLGFVGSNQYPLWALMVMGLTTLVLYALIVRWGEYAQEARS